MAKNYQEVFQSAITEDDSRSQWSVAQWRAYFLEVVTGKKQVRLTSTGIMDLFGPTDGSVMLSALEANYPHIYRLLQPSEGGIDLSHPDTEKFVQRLVTSGLVSASNATKLQAMAVTTDKRHVLLGLPDPRERLMRTTLQQLGD